MERDGATITGPAGLVGELAALTEAYMTGIREVAGRLAEHGDNRELIAASVLADRAIRSAEATAAGMVEAVERRGLYLDDGHVNVKSWLKASVQLAPSDQSRRLRIADFCRRLPAVGEALQTGRIGVGFANRMALTWVNKRVRADFELLIEAWLIFAEHDDYDTFDKRLAEWERLTDQDGGHRDRDETHARRNVRLDRVGDQWVLRGQFAGLQGEILHEIFQHFVDCEYRYDADEAKACLGVDHVTPADLARTPGQRRADAMTKMAHAAAAAPLEGKPIDVRVDIVIDQVTFEQQLLELLDPLHQHRQKPPSAPACGFDPDDPSFVYGLGPDTDSVGCDGVGHDGCGDGCGSDGRPGRVKAMCHTVRGTPVDPVDALHAALLGRVRRVVIGARSAVIDLGVNGKVFVGSSRDAVYLQAAIDGLERCIFPGCTRVPRQIDHSTARADGGPTRPGNGGPMCRHHNLIKCQGYTTRRDASGHWHIYRPDGTEIAPH